MWHASNFISVLVSASRKQKYFDRGHLNAAVASNYGNCDGANASSKLMAASMGTSLDSTLTDFDPNGIDNSIASNAASGGITATAHIKRYKMERKNSQQSQHGKQEMFAAQGGSTKSSIQLDCDSSLAEYVGEKEIRVKIADLGNACYNVSGKISGKCWHVHSKPPKKTNSFQFSCRIIILPRTSKRVNIVRSR